MRVPRHPFLIISTFSLAVIGSFFLIISSFGILGLRFSAIKDSDLNPSDPITVYASLPMIPDSYLAGISADSRKDFEIKREGKKILLYPKYFWPVGKEITLDFPSGRMWGIIPVRGQEISVRTIDYPKLGSVLPLPGSKDISIGIEDPIEVNFASSTLGFTVRFETVPERELEIKSNTSKKKFQILPKEKFADGERVNLRVFLKFSKERGDSYREIYSGNFITLPPAPLEWEKDLSLRLAQAKRLTRPKIMAGKYIDINLENQIMAIFENGKLLDAFLVSSGKRGMETPKGEHEVYNKNPRTWSKQYGLFMPFWMAMTASGKYGIHELPEWPGGYKEGANHLGIPVSHGCVRLGVGSAERVYNFADIGTKVIVY